MTGERPFRPFDQLVRHLFQQPVQFVGLTAISRLQIQKMDAGKCSEPNIGANRGCFQLCRKTFIQRCGFHEELAGCRLFVTLPFPDWRYGPPSTHCSTYCTKSDLK